jgi:cysteinyl-tRNA synthetase
VRRWLEASGLRVDFVRNITDIDDKMIRRAVENGETVRALAERMTAFMYADYDALNILRPTHDPRATDFIPQMLGIIERLESRKLAYRAEGGDVNFAVRALPGYGKLSGKPLDELRAGERVAVLEGKQDPLDFVLWKSAKPTEPPDAKWESPYGPGRPGWHIECSAMAHAILGQPIDIHGGGSDLIFPHHENEIAQSVCAHNGRGPEDFARFWMHNGMLTVGGAKMAKSERNFVTVRDALAQAPGEVTRLALLMTHYRDPLDWTEDRLQQARQTLDRWYRALGLLAAGSAIAVVEPPSGVIEALSDDLNAPLAISRVHATADAIYRSDDETERFRLQREMAAGARLMGLLDQPALAWLQGTTAEREVVERRIAERVQARRERRFADADRVRAELLAEGIVLEDKPDGTTTWRRE